MSTSDSTSDSSSAAKPSQPEENQDELIIKQQREIEQEVRGRGKGVGIGSPEVDEFVFGLDCLHEPAGQRIARDCELELGVLGRCDLHQQAEGLVVEVSRDSAHPAGRELLLPGVRVRLPGVSGAEQERVQQVLRVRGQVAGAADGGRISALYDRGLLRDVHGGHQQGEAGGGQYGGGAGRAAQAAQ